MRQVDYHWYVSGRKFNLLDDSFWEALCEVVEIDLDNLLTSLRETHQTADLASLRSWLEEDSGAMALLESYQEEYPEAFQ